MSNWVKRALRQRLTYANVVASLAAFGALAGGGAYAAGELGAQAKGVGNVKEVRVSKNITDEQETVWAKCPDGRKVISGGSGSGISDTAANSDVAILENHRLGNGWIVIAVTQAGPRTIDAYAYCVKN